MEPRADEKDPFADSRPTREQQLPETQATDAEDKSKKVSTLLRERMLVDAFGAYEVRTTITLNRRAWGYRCSVLHKGVEIDDDSFRPISVDRRQGITHEASITEEMRLALATEAIEKHGVTCAEMARHLTAQSPPRKSSVKILVFVALIAVAILATLGAWKLPLREIWKGLESERNTPPPEKPPPRIVRWKENKVVYQSPYGQPFAYRLPELERIPNDLPVEVMLDPSGNRPGWLEFQPQSLQISGTAPPTTKDIRYILKFRAAAKNTPESLLQIDLTITGRPQSPPPKPDEDCILKILEGKPC